MRLMVTNARLMTMTRAPMKTSGPSPRRSPKAEVVAAGVFKATCLALLDAVETRGTTFVVTKRGRAVARLVPLAAPKGGSLRGSLVHEEDLLAPVDAGWEERA